MLNPKIRVFLAEGSQTVEACLDDLARAATRLHDQLRALPADA